MIKSRTTFQEGWYRLVYEHDDLPPIRIWLTAKEARSLLSVPRRRNGLLQSSMVWRLGFGSWSWEAFDTAKDNKEV